MYFGIFNLGPVEIIVVLLIVLLLFGPKKLPQIGRSFGEMLSNFRKGSGELKDEDEVKDQDKGRETKSDVNETDKDKR